MARTLKTRTLSPDEAVRIASSVAPELPPATLPSVSAQPVPDKPGMLSVRLMESSLTALARAARDQGVTQRQVVAKALAAAGVTIAQADLEDRPAPRRRV
jgi:hypothetical protein